MRTSATSAAVLALAIPTHAFAQAAELRVRENMRAEPGGEVIAVMDSGTTFEVVGRREAWVEVALEGWVWMRSLQATDRGGYDLVVSASGGENMRARPSGRILGRLERGTLLAEVERSPGWIRARRVAWIWAASVELPEPAPAEGGPEPSGEPAPGPEAGAEPAAFPSMSSTGAPILATPGGDTLARPSAGVELQVVGREGDWARVRLEGWTLLPEEPDPGAGAPELAPSELIAEPERYRGQVVLLRLQFLSLERAESVRTDFQEGEPFLLTRHVSGNYVYVALAEGRLAEALALAPLERITVVGRVRTSSSALTGSPILDLIELERAGP